MLMSAHQTIDSRSQVVSPVQTRTARQVCSMPYKNRRRTHELVILNVGKNTYVDLRHSMCAERSIRSSLLYEYYKTSRRETRATLVGLQQSVKFSSHCALVMIVCFRSRRGIVTSSPGGGCKVYWWVCLSVCLSARITQKPYGQNSPNICASCLWSVAVAWSSSDSVVMRHVLPVLWITSYSHIMALLLVTSIPNRR